MRSTLRIPLLVASVCCAWWGATEEAVPPAPSPDQLETWARELGADDFAKREEAQQRLAAAGQAAVPALRKAAESDDPEVRLRAERLLTPLTRDDRLLEAARALGSTEWDKVSRAIDVLLERCDAKSENAVSQVADGAGREATMARVLLKQIAQVRMADDELARMVELGKTNPAVRQVVERKMGEVRRVYRQRAYESCLKEFEKLKAEPQEDRKAE